MEEGQIRTVRRFNRMVTQRVGALDDEYLGRTRPLGASRLLWEIASEGSDLKVLRSRLGLDSGYFSRLVRRLEAEGLVELRPDPADQRARVALLTPAGRAEQRELDRRSDTLARSLLNPLNPTQRGQLLDAMVQVERLLTAGLVDVAVADPHGADAQHCLDCYFAELDARFEGGFDPAVDTSAPLAELAAPSGVFLVARLRGEPIGCAGVKLPRGEPAIVKRMWVAPAARGLGVGRRVLTMAEDHARRTGASVVRLETNGALVEAIQLYRSAGYVELPAYEDVPYADHWFEKPL